MTIAQTATTKQTALIADIAEIARLRAEIERERARADKAERELLQAQAMLTTAAEQGKHLAELRKIFKGNDWGPTERGTLAAMLFHGWEQSQTTTHWLHVCEGGAATLADVANVSRNTANNLIQRYQSAGIVSREVTKTALNGIGEPIPTKYFKEGECRWQNSSLIAVTATLPSELPPLANDTKQAKANRASASEKRKLAKMAKQLQEMPCPHCGVVGELHIGCNGCHHTFTTKELETLAEQAEQREETEPTRRAQPMTTTQARTANGRRRMRDVRGVASTPRPSVTYQGFDDGGISITLAKGDKADPLHILCAVDGQTNPAAHTMCSASASQNWELSVYDSAKSVSSTADIGRENTDGGDSEGPDYDWSAFGGVNHA